MTQIIVSLCGGLGNQLFQYAMGRALAERNAAELVLNLEWYNAVQHATDTTVRQFALDPFNLPLKKQTSTHSTRLSTRILKRIKSYLPIKTVDIPQFSERGFTFDPNTQTLKAPVKINGYWQSHKYFSDCADLIREQLYTPTKLNAINRKIFNEITACNAICVHVRRGDYVTNKNAAATHGLCDLSYYEKGVAQIAAGLSSPKCFIFSDDPEWVRNTMHFDIPMTVVDINGPDDAHQDLWLMASCQHFVIANSSLSWWGAWLSSHKEKKVVAPATWFLSDEHDTKDLIPENWIRI